MTNKPPKAIIIQAEPITVDVEQAALLHCVSPNTIRKWIDRTDYPRLKVGGRLLVPVAKARQWVDDHAGEVIDL